jgi:glycosyltransferase involved in cell wall biosynthesis
VATPGHTQVDENKARALADLGMLRFLAMGTRRGAKDVPADVTLLNPKIGLAAYFAARTMSVFKAESFRWRLNPWFDSWVRRHLVPGDHILSSFGSTNASFDWARRNGGKTFLSAGNSHPENFWNLLAEEHRRWNCPLPPISRFHIERSKRMLPLTDYVFAPSSFVADSFLSRGFTPAQMLKDVYPVDFSCFTPPLQARDPGRPLTIVATGGLSLRKGAPYMLEAFRLVRQKHPSARFRITRIIHDSALEIVARYRDLPVDWSPSLPHPQLAELLRTSDIFVLASLEEGMARTALEAMACGLPVVLTPNTGSADYVTQGVNGEIVPIRDARAMADAILKWADLILAGRRPECVLDTARFSYDAYARHFEAELRAKGFETRLTS